MNFKGKIVFGLLFILGIFDAKSQEWKVNVLAGTAGYIGDINSINLLQVSGYSVSTSVKYNFNSMFALGLHYTNGKIAASDASASDLQLRQRNLNFSSSLNELSVMFDFNFFRKSDVLAVRRFYPYVFAGVGGVLFNPTTIYDGQKIFLKNYETENVAYKTYTLVIPYGVGFNYTLNDTWGVFAQIGYRATFSDYLDDVSGVYPSKANLQSDVTRIALSDRSGEQNNNYIGVAGTQRGDFRKSDIYMFAGIGISYTFVSQKCYKVK